MEIKKKKYFIKKHIGVSKTLEGNYIIGSALDDLIELQFTLPWTKELICLLDGSMSVEEVYNSLKKKHNDAISYDQLLKQISILEENKIIGDVDLYESTVRNNSELSRHEFTRYDRQLSHFDSVSDSISSAVQVQTKLKKAKVCLIGIGGVGSYVFYALAAMGLGKIKVSEFDKVELSNLSRQILYNEDDLGKSKIKVAETKSSRINSNVSFEFVNKKIDTVETAIEFMDGYDLAISAADTPRGKLHLILNEASHRCNTPYLDAGSINHWVQCGPLIVPGETPCHQCGVPTNQSSEDDITKFIGDRYTSTLIDPYNSTAGSFAALEAVKFLTKLNQPSTLGKILYMNMMTYETHLVPIERKANCQFCSN